MTEMLNVWFWSGLAELGGGWGYESEREIFDKDLDKDLDAVEQKWHLRKLTLALGG